MMGALSGVTGRRQAVCSSTLALGNGGEDAFGALHNALAADADGSRSKPTSSSVVPVHSRPLGFFTK